VTATLTVTCDRCGTEILTDRTVFDVRCGPLRARRESLDLCTDCLPVFLEWLKASKKETFAPCNP
jgi:hypothetical protein